MASLVSADTAKVFTMLSVIALWDMTVWKVYPEDSKLPALIAQFYVVQVTDDTTFLWTAYYHDLQLLHDLPWKRCIDKMVEPAIIHAQKKRLASHFTSWPNTSYSFILIVDVNVKVPDPSLLGSVSNVIKVSVKRNHEYYSQTRNSVYGVKGFQNILLMYKHDYHAYPQNKQTNNKEAG